METKGVLNKKTKNITLITISSDAKVEKQFVGLRRGKRIMAKMRMHLELKKQSK